MKIHRIDHVGIVVNDLAAAKAFFLDFGLTLKSEGPVEGEWVNHVVGLKDVKAEIAMVQTPDGQMSLELTKFLRHQVKKKLSTLWRILWAFGI